MSDDLVKRLRCPPFGTETTERNLMEEAAARIAALEAAVTQCRTLSAMLKPQAARIAELEAALKKIVEKTRHAHPLSYVSDYYRIASAALEGGKKDER